MAEGILGGLLGEDEERPEVEAPEGTAAAEAFAAAVAARLSANDPDVARETTAFLREQTRLLKIQSEHIEDEHALRMAHLHNQVKEENVRRLGLRLRVTIQLFAALIAIVLAIGLALMVHDAVTSRQVIIEPINTPPSLASDGLNGRALAAGLLDVLTNIQAASRSNVEHRNLSNAWTNEIAIEVPETGISIGQLQKLLRERFGHDQHIDGDLVRTSTGLELTVRGNGILAKTFEGKIDGVVRLLKDAGEYVYSQSQPGLWTAYLTNNNRYDEAIRFAKEAFNSIDPTERPYVLNYWANAVAIKGGPNAMVEALTLYREAVRLKPEYWSGYTNIMYALNGLGREEEAIRVGKEMMQAAGGRPGKAPESEYQNYDQMLSDLPAVYAAALSDLQSHGGVGTNGSGTGAESLYVANIEINMHDVEAASLRLKTTIVDEGNVVDWAQAATLRANIAEELENFEMAAKEWDKFARAYANPIVSTSNPQTLCGAAVTYKKAGQHSKADAALNAVGDLQFIDCYRGRGDVLDLRGDWAGAQEWYAKAVNLGPSIPWGYYSWGVALAKHGDLEGAAAKFKDANQRGPHWADPLKAWGDVLVKQGKPKEALAKYDEALKYAPNWKQLKEARAVIAQAKG